MNTSTHAGECPQCFADILPADLQEPCAMCGALPKADPQPVTYTLFGVTPSDCPRLDRPDSLKVAGVRATFSTTSPREALARARAEGGPHWTLVAEAGTDRARFVYGHTSPRASADAMAEADRRFGQPHHGHSRDADLV
jgi:hypothetical protein